MEYHYEIILKNHFNSLKRVLNTLSICLVLSIVLYRQSILSTIGLLAAWLFMSITGVLPTAILHIQYYLKNRNAKLVINSTDRTISYNSNSKNSTELKYSFNQIKAFELYDNYAGGNGMYTWGLYRYYELIFFDDKRIIITTLLLGTENRSLEDILQIQPVKHMQFLTLIRR